MTISQAYSLLQLIYSKSQSGNITPAQWNNAADICQISMINELLGNEAEYRPGMPVPQTGFSINQKNRQELQSILKPLTTIPVTAGLMAWPSDCLYYNALTTAGGVLIKECTADEVAILNQSQICPPSLSEPNFVLASDGALVYPSTIVSVKLTYVRKPITPVWNYTVVNNVPVYAATGGVIGDGVSHDWELSELVHYRICWKIAQIFGLNLSIGELVQFSTQLEQSGS